MIKTHMPFINKIDDKFYKLFCQYHNGTWKLCIRNQGQESFVNTHLPPYFTECSPVFWQEKDFVEGSFIAGGGDVQNWHTYNLYSFLGVVQESSLELFEVKKVVNTKVGCLFPNGIAYARQEMQNKQICSFLVIFMNDEEYTYRLEQHIYRISFNPKNHTELFISYGIRDDVYAMSLNLITGQQYQIICDNNPAYKVALYDQNVEYALRIGEGFEDRIIVKAHETIKIPIELLHKE